MWRRKKKKTDKKKYSSTWLGFGGWLNLCWLICTAHNTFPLVPTEPGWFLLTAYIMLHFEEFVSSFSHSGTNRKAFETGMDVVLCETRREEKGGRKKILFVCRCQVELCRDLVMSVWLCMYVCILEKLLWEAVYLPCTAKLILLTVWKIDAMSLSSCLHVSAAAAAAAAPCRLGPRSTWWRCGSTSTASLVFLTLAPVLTWFCPLFSSIAASYVLLCLSLFPPLSCWQRLNVTPSAVTCCCAGVYEGECFISAAPGMDSGLAWPSLAWLGCTWPLQQAHKKQTLGVCVRACVCVSMWVNTRWIFFLIRTQCGMNYILV